MISHWYRALVSRLPLPARGFTLKVLIAKAQFTACSSHDVIKTNCSPRVTYDNLIALWKKELMCNEPLLYARYRA